MPEKRKGQRSPNQVKNSYLRQGSQVVEAELQVGGVGGAIKSSFWYFGYLIVAQIEESYVGAIFKSSCLDFGDGVVRDVDCDQVEVLESELLYFSHEVLGDVDEFDVIQLEEHLVVDLLYFVPGQIYGADSGDRAEGSTSDV